MNSQRIGRDRELWWFLILTFAWSWLLWFPKVMHTAGHIQLSPVSLQVLGGAAVFGPCVAGILLTAVSDGGAGVKRLLGRAVNLRFAKRWLIPTLFLMPVLTGLTILIMAAWRKSILWEYGLPLPMVVPVFIMIFLLNALPEELGWRGYALDRLLSKWNALQATIALGVVWAAWHLPLHFISGTTQEHLPIWQFACITIASSFIYTWLHKNTGGSVLIATLFHTMCNITPAVVPYWITDLGRIISFLMLLVAVVIIVSWYGKNMVSRLNNALPTKPLS